MPWTHIEHLLLPMLCDNAEVVLLCCPFCQALDISAEQPHPSEPDWAVECARCGTIGPAGETRLEAERLWNERGVVTMAGEDGMQGRVVS